MLAKFFRSTPAGPPSAAVPGGTRVYAIGDVHGRLDLLQNLHEQICEHAREYPIGRAVVVHIGDYIDRGYQSRQTIDYLLDSPLAGFDMVNLLGNHERTLLEFLDDLSVGPGWLRYGGRETLFSYDIEWDRDLAGGEESLQRIQSELRRKLPERHRRFFSGLPLTHEVGDYLFVHAGVRPGIPLERQAPDDLLWIREEFLNSTADHGKVVVHGHSISETPVLRPNRVGIDTGAFATGRLTCLVLEGNERSFLSTQP
ncbi:MAG TPA: metallophosphoesterase family protein [Alphaproteobacteria bacterium]|nr:metallophosphoesterase family protein [Alphaproteobacteria bacterium]